MTADEVKRVQLELLAKLATMCAVSATSFQLAYGTLLGAVRHQAYIPWDDDIDVWMLRRDYDCQGPVSSAHGRS